MTDIQTKLSQINKGKSERQKSDESTETDIQAGDQADISFGQINRKTSEWTDEQRADRQTVNDQQTDGQRDCTG